MARLSGFHIGKQARALAAALVLGATGLALTPGQTAYAARGITNETGDGGTSGGGAGPAPRMNINDFPKCTITRPDGSVDFYLPGNKIVRDGKTLYCGFDGEWVVTRPGLETTWPASGGVYAP